jgi:hypothetical protein
MADYEIDVPVLEKSKTSLGELKETVNKIGESYSSTTIKEAKEGYDIVARKITNNMERLTKGYTNSYTWLTGYTTDLNTLEQSLTSLNLATLTKPIEFKGKFNDIFGKVTMPALKTGGDPNCNEDLVTIGLKGDTPQEQIFNYLKSKGFNNAAICGILANIQHESSFKTDALGDGGTSYGICQWHNGRWNNLKSYCNNNGLDWHSMEGQLEYLIHELETGYTSVYNTLKNVPNTAQGAYDAAYKWTVSFEIPANKEAAGQRRGSTASSTYWNTYANL